MMKYARIRKDGFVTSRPWVADLILDGRTWKSWMFGFKTKKALIAEIKAVDNTMTIVS